MPRLSPRSGIAVAAAVLVLAGLPLLAGGGRSPEGSIPTYDAVLSVRTDGTVHVREAFTFDYAGVERHGLLREIRYRKGNRVYRITNLSVASSTRAPVNVKRRTFAHREQVRIGAGHSVSGRHAYVLTYDVHGAFSRRHGRDEFLWDALGTRWSVPVSEAAVRIEAPAPFGSGCLAGRPEALTRCVRHALTPNVTDFTQIDLRPEEGMTVRAAFRPGALHPPPPSSAPAHFGFTVRGPVAVLAAMVLALLVRPRRLREARLPLIGAGTVLILWDAVADMVPGGFWFVSVGDPSLYGLALVTLALPPWRGRRGPRPQED
ncbi:hypothetical protein GCM10010468_65750 [Actinocorallia longicatena]|uniref:DUF2207 domain-containing protein n=2 Tax=Actinocorallia longicatena TaxID=111803 RepID=A0ABP6QIG1_9ACTN